VIHHRAHDYRHLVERWRAVARKTGVPLRRLARADGFDVFSLRTPALRETGGIYVSAGIHGDEAASTEGLITWAENQGRRLARLPLFLLPCLNPWGLVLNRRSNAAGEDLNRSFHREDLPVINEVKTLAAPYRFSASLMLHEDYDGQGVYLYEVQRVRPYWGEALLTAARAHLPTDPRPRIDGRKVTLGVHRRRPDRRRFAQIGYPEAIWLHQERSARTFTVETPSEFALEQRVAAQVAMLDEMVRLVAASE
jgi:protein MpaA